MCASRSANDVETPRHQTFDQIEMRDEAHIKPRIDAARRRQQRHQHPNSSSRIRPQRKSGMARPAATPRIDQPIRRAAREPRHQSSAKASPSAMAISVASSASSSVAGSRGAGSASTTSCRKLIERPKSPHGETGQANCANCSGMRSVEPIEMRAAGRYRPACAPGGIIIAMGSPGTTRSSTNDDDRDAEQRRRMRQRGACSMLRAESHARCCPVRILCLCDQLRQDHAVDLRRRPSISFLWMIGCTYWNSGITSPSSAMYLSTAFQPAMRLASSFSPQSGPICSLERPCPSRRNAARGRTSQSRWRWWDRRSHCPNCRTRPAPARARRAARNAARFRKPRSSRLDADLPPHPDDRLDHLVILRLEAARRLDREFDRLVRRVAALGQQRSSPSSGS